MKISNALFAGDNIIDLVEKLRKLLYWEDQWASTVALVVILLAFFVVTFIPLRMVIILWLYKKFKRGSTWYKRRYIGNRECCRIELRNFFLENSLIPFEVLFGDETEWLGKPWPKGQDHQQLKKKF